MGNLTGKLAALHRRIEQLKREHPAEDPCHWVIPIVEWDPEISGDLERVEAETLAAARAAGWTPEKGIVGIFIPNNHRDYELESDAEQEES